ncbi:hypothetical protein jhhlp_007816 [Lomentospora prolificans]|uniref:NAD-specific glutamate dehydrogenase n=1 Tax=Lomentospora prolificans TaxID=41688 RepID=A0A2N3N0M8_9PEZI|nr:hypothetical protein jhhlp_007816 [Lomentospora prolificans]
MFIIKKRGLKVILIREDLFATLAAGHTLLLLLAGLVGRELGLLLGCGDLVAHGVELVLTIVILGGETGTATLALDPVVAGGSHLTVHDGPYLLSQVLGELGRVGNDDDTTLELLERLGERTKRVTVEIVGGLVKNDQVRSLPRAGGKDDLDTLTTRETAHARVRDKLSVETEVGAVSLDLATDEGTELTGGEGLLHVNLGNELLMGGENLSTGNPLVIGRHHRSPALVLLANVLTEAERALVFVAVLELAASVDANDAAVGTINLVDLVHGLLIILGDNLVGTVHGLTILTSLETPLDVLGGGLIQVVINVRESVLLDVGNTHVLVLVDLTSSGDELTSEHVDERGLASTVGADNGNTGAERALEGDIRKLRLLGTGVLEAHLGGTENGLGLGLDTLKETGLGEAEFDLGGAELVVRAGRGALADELLEVTLVTLELEAFVVDDVLGNVVEETSVVGHDDGGAGGVDEVVLEPLDVLHVQMVGGLVEEKDIGSLEDGTAKSELHLPTTGKGSDLTADHAIGKTELVEGLDDLLLGGIDLGLLELLHGPVDGRHLSIGRVQVVLDEDSLDLRLLREALDLLVVDGTHEGRLAGTVGTAETVTLTALEAERSLVEKNLGTIGEGESAVAKVLALLIVFISLIGIGSTRGGTLAESFDNGLRVGITDNDGDVRLDVLSPGGGLGLLLVNELASESRSVLEDRSELLGDSSVLGRKDLLEFAEDDSDVTIVADLGDLAVLDGTDTGKCVKGLLRLLTSLRVGESLVVLLKSGHHLGQERSDDIGVVDELTHVVDNDGRLSLDGSLTLSKTTVKKRNHESEGRLLDLGDESGGTEQVNSLGDVLRLGDTLDELRNEALNILVDNERADLLHRLIGALLDVLLGIPHGLGNDGDQVRNTEGYLSGGGLDEGIEEVEGDHLLLPLLGSGDGGHDGGEDSLDSIGVDGLSDGEGGGGGLILDSRDLVSRGSEDGREKSNKEGLDVGRDLRVLSDSGDGDQGLFTGKGVLLASKLLLEGFDSPVGKARVNIRRSR